MPPGPVIAFAEASAVADLYGLPKQFFFMPNQFWRHKNHELVLDALNILRERGKEVVVAASGKQSDLRTNDYFTSFLEKLNQTGLQNMFKLLGIIPYAHLKSLMMVSSALLNPSLFEGWSTTVEEARSMGTPMILSDLDVHREQMGHDAIYFDRHSAQSLADTMDMFIPLDESQRILQIETARNAAFQRVEQFALNFVDFVQFAVSTR